jgi:hypothetical protein
LKCVAGPAAEGIFGPGHYVYYNAANQSKVTLTEGSLFLEKCLVPGVKEGPQLMADLEKQGKPIRSVFRTLTTLLIEN